MRLNKAGELRKYHQFIGIFQTKMATFDHKSTNQPKPPEENKKFVIYKEFVIINSCNYTHKSSYILNRKDFRRRYNAIV